MGVMGFLRIFRVALMVGRSDFLFFWSWKTWLLCWMVRMTTQASALVLLGEMLGSPGRIRYLMVGNAVAMGVAALSWTVSASAWDRFEGVFPFLVIAPSRMLPSVMGRTVVWVLNGIVTSLVMFAFFGLVFGWRAPWRDLLLLPFFVTVICLSGYGLALFLGALIARTPRWRNITGNILTTLTMAVCGVNVPVDFWPGWVQGMANLLPITHGLQALRLFLDHGSTSLILQSLGLEILVGLGWFTLAALSMDYLANAGRTDGSIEFT